MVCRALGYEGVLDWLLEDTRSDEAPVTNKTRGRMMGIWAQLGNARSKYPLTYLTDDDKQGQPLMALKMQCDGSEPSPFQCGLTEYSMFLGDDEPHCKAMPVAIQCWAGVEGYEEQTCAVLADEAAADGDDAGGCCAAGCAPHCLLLKPY